MEERKGLRHKTMLDDLNGERRHITEIAATIYAHRDFGQPSMSDALELAVDVAIHLAKVVDRRLCQEVEAIEHELARRKEEKNAKTGTPEEIASHVYQSAHNGCLCDQCHNFRIQNNFGE
jgi:hypothetical protein